jgi:putative transcriptional regulator
MSMRKRFLFAMLFTIVALGAAARVSVYKAKWDVPKPNSWLRAPVPVAAALPWYDSRPSNMPSRRLKAYRTKGELPPALFLPIQFKNPQKNPEDLGVGKLLVASRGLGDPDFAGTVVLLVHYDEKGALGLILNRRTDIPLSRVLDLEAAKDRSDPIYLGGPVGPSAVFALFASSAKMEKAENIFGGVYLISDKALFEQTISARPDAGVFHVYLGYAGWAQDQLRNEVQLGAWFVLPADATTVFNADPDSLWLQMIQKTELQLAKTEPFAVHSMRQHDTYSPELALPSKRNDPKGNTSKEVPRSRRTAAINFYRRRATPSPADRAQKRSSPWPREGTAATEVNAGRGLPADSPKATGAPVPPGTCASAPISD